MIFVQQILAFVITASTTPMVITVRTAKPDISEMLKIKHAEVSKNYEEAKTEKLSDRIILMTLVHVVDQRFWCQVVNEICFIAMGNGKHAKRMRNAFNLSSMTSH